MPSRSPFHITVRFFIGGCTRWGTTGAATQARLRKEGRRSRKGRRVNENATAGNRKAERNRGSGVNTGLLSLAIRKKMGEKKWCVVALGRKGKKKGHLWEG